MNICHSKKEAINLPPSPLSSPLRGEGRGEGLCQSISYDKGFTLLEVLIALAIFAVAAIVCLQAYLSSVKHVQIMTEEKNYILLSTLKIEELKMKTPEDMDQTAGTFPEPFDGYEWSLELSGLSVTDTEHEMTFIPYNLTVRQQGREFSTIAPLVKTEKEETVQRIE